VSFLNAHSREPHSWQEFVYWFNNNNADSLDWTVGELEDVFEIPEVVSGEGSLLLLKDPYSDLQEAFDQRIRVRLQKAL
jgi:hypothetical protein